MKQLIIQGLQQAYQNLVHMISIFLPRLVAMLLIMLVGLFVALLLKYLLRLILRFTQLNRLSEQSGASQVLRNAALPTISELLTRSLFWVTWLAFTLVGISILGIPELHEQLSRLFQLLPEVFVAILILFVGVLAANFLSRAALLAAVNAGVRSPRLWSGSTRFVILILAISMALEQIGLANQTVTSAFSIIFGALMLAVAIAFGLGGRDLARQTLERYLGDNKRRDREREKEEEPSPL
jgi:small-conductance mechanosensitive channel